MKTNMWIDINLKNSKFYIVEVRVDDYRNGEHYFNTSDNIFLFKSLPTTNILEHLWLT